MSKSNPNLTTNSSAKAKAGQRVVEEWCNKPYVVPEYTRPSKSQKKREVLAIKDLGEQLTELKLEKALKAPVSDEIKEALRLYDTIKNHHGAARRQRLLIGKLMTQEDTQAIEEWIDQQLMRKKQS
jgi:ribosomal 50S subunit-associated protein YjgA (DUF615 family)